MSLWTETIPHPIDSAQDKKEEPFGQRWFEIDSAMRSSAHQLDGARFEAVMRADMRVLALAGFFPERGYKRIGVFNEAVEVMKELGRLTQ